MLALLTCYLPLNLWLYSSTKSALCHNNEGDDYEKGCGASCDGKPYGLETYVTDTAGLQKAAV